MEALVGVLTVSDTRTAATDLSGPEAEKALVALGFKVAERRLCADEVPQIQAALKWEGPEDG